MRIFNKPALLLVSASALTLACASAAQAATPAAPSAGDELAEVVVTGSRVITNGNDSPTPVTVVTTEDLKDVRPGNLVEALNDMPLFNGSKSQYTNSGTGGAAGSPASSQNAVNAVNLRQLGVQRTLVLFDGHRASPSSPDGTVDLNTIPQMLIKRVDVVTGGVSAVYGSDAMTGVLNFVVDNKFEGLKASVQGGRSSYHDAGTSEAAVAFGTNLFGGRGHIEGSVEYRHQAAIDSKFARPWGNNVWTLQGMGTAAQPYFQVTGARVSNSNANGRVVNSAVFGDSQFVAGGTVIPFVHGVRLGLAPAFNASTNCASCEIGGDGGVFNGQLRSGLDMSQFFGRFDYDLTDSLHGNLTVADSLNRSLATGNYTSNSAYTICRDNAFLATQFKTANCGTGNTFNMGKIFTEIPRGETESHSRQLFVNGGLQGSLGQYKWDVNVTRSNTRFDVRQNQTIDQGRFFASLDSVLNSSGQPVCRASLTNSLYSGCVPLNPFGANSGSQAAVAYFMTRQNYTTTIGMQDASASITGAPFNTWAGPVNAALSAEWRKTSYRIDSFTPDPLTARANCTGIQVGCAATTTVYNASVASVAEVSQKVSEGAVEFQLPLAKEQAWAKALALNTAYRYAKYDRAGNANTWKFGLTWNINDKLTVRTTRSRDFRAPTLDENFRFTSLSAPGRGFGDTLPGNPDSAVGLGPFASTLNGGNPDLKNEQGNTLTLGVVVNPTSNVDIAVDAFNIKITNAIFLIQGNTPTYQNACYAGGGTSASNPGTSAYCQLIVRNAAGSVTQWKQTFINLAELDSVGADIELGWRTTIKSRPLSLRVLSTYQPHLIYKQPGIADSDYAGSSFGTNAIQASPVWRATLFASYKPLDNFSVSVQERWRGNLPKVDGAPPWAAAPAVYSGDAVRSFATTNLNLTYTPKLSTSKLDVFLNIQNLFNSNPPQAGFWGNPTPGQFGEFIQGDDVIGRYFTAGARFRL